MVVIGTVVHISEGSLLTMIRIGLCELLYVKIKFVRREREW